jgi:hypothetical protein
MSFPMSNRSTFVVEYRKEHGEELTMVYSSKGTEALAAQWQASIGNNVLASCIIQFARYTPVSGGYQIITVTCEDPAGSMPQFLKDKQATQHANAPINLANIMLTGAT